MQFRPQLVSKRENRHLTSKDNTSNDKLMIAIQKGKKLTHFKIKTPLLDSGKIIFHMDMVYIISTTKKSSIEVDLLTGKCMVQELCKG